MICHRCQYEYIEKRDERGIPRYYCRRCGYSWHECKSKYDW